MHQDFYIGQVFTQTFPEGIDQWCIKNSAVVVQVDPVDTNQRCFRIQSIPQITYSQFKMACNAAIQDLLDRTAKSKGYDSAVACISYINSTQQTWASQSKAFNAWRDSVWCEYYKKLQSIQKGTIQQPTVQEILTELPILNWNKLN